MTKRFFRALPVCVLLACAGCNTPDQASQSQAASEAQSGAQSVAQAAPAAAARPAADTTTTKIKVEDASGKTLFTLQTSDKGYRVEDASGAKIGSIKVEADRVKASDGAGKPLYKIKRQDDGFKLYREPAQAGGADIEEIQIKADAGGFKIKGLNEQQLFQGKTKGDKVKVSASGGQSMEVKTKPDGVEVEDATGQRLLRLKGVQSPIAAVICAAPQFDTLRKAAVIAYTLRSGS